MTRQLFKTICFFLVSMAITVQSQAEWVYVERVIDGDTFVTSDGVIVRVRDIDTPETKHPRIGAEPGGQEATQLAKFFLEENYVWLEGESHDKYGRRLSAVTVVGGASYADIVRSHGYDKMSNSIYSRLGTYRYNLGMSSYKPRTSAPRLKTSFAGTTWINGYLKSDGTWVSGHWKSTPGFTGQSIYTAPSSLFPKSPTSSSGGQVHVKGYFRKDGTYVAPHTRSKRK
jgi:hypothetical protein